jgi:hypothetical protein
LDSNGQGGLATISKGLCTGCTILSGRYLLDGQYTNGTKFAPGQNPIYIHHFTSSNVGRRVENPISGCLGSSSSGDFIDAGQDSGLTDTIFTSADGSFNSGFHMKTPELRVNYDLVNQINENVNLFVKLEIEWVEGFQGVDAGHSLKSVKHTSFSN